MIMKILQLGAETLTQVSKPVENFDSRKLQKLIDEMIETCEADRKGTAGLAAPQVGVNWRLSVIRRVDLEDRANSISAKASRVKAKQVRGAKSVAKTAKIQSKISQHDLWEPIINPVLVSTDIKHESLIWEACLSIGQGDKQLWGPVWRPDKIAVEYQDRHGAKHRLKAQGFMSHLIQHEIDHLDGVLFINHIGNPERNLWLSVDLDKYLDQHHEYPAEL